MFNYTNKLKQNHLLGKKNYPFAVLMTKSIETSKVLLNTAINNVHTRNEYEIDKFCCFPFSFNDAEQNLFSKKKNILLVSLYNFPFK